MATGNEKGSLPRGSKGSPRRGLAPTIVLGTATVTLLLAASPVGAATDKLGLGEALRLTLERDPNIAIFDRRARAAEGFLLRQRAAFDPAIGASVTGADSELPTGTSGATTTTETVVQSFGLIQQLRSGLLLLPTVELESIATDGGEALDEATVAFGLRQPLLRGRGRRVTTAGEVAAEADLAASQLDLAHTVDLRLRAVAFAYWSAVEARRDLEVLEATEASSRELLGTIRRLIEADVIPAAEVVQLEADLVTKEASRIGGEQALLVTMRDLGREIGLAPVEIDRMPEPGDAFPAVSPEELTRLPSTAAFLAAATAYRRDLRAARRRVEAARLRALATTDTLKPRLDLVLTPSYSGLATGSSLSDLYAPLSQNVPGLSVTLTVDFERPLFNRDAAGARIEAEAAVEEAELFVDLVERQVGAEVPIALGAVERGAAQLARTDEAVRLFERAVDNEEKKLRAGSSTLIDVISQRDRLTDARRRRVAAEAALARALAELRFQTGTLVAEGEAGVSPLRLITIPDPEANP